VLTHSAHHPGSLNGFGARHSSVAASGMAFASFVFDGHDFTSRISTPLSDGLAAYFSSKARLRVTNGSAWSMTTTRRSLRNGSVSSSLRTVENSALSPG